MSIRAMRERAGLTQVDLAGKVNVEQCTVSRWERGAKPLQKYIRQLCFVFKCTEDELLRKEDE